MLRALDSLLAEMAGAQIDLAPRRFGRVTACDGGLIEASGLNVPVGGLCRIDDGKGHTLTAEVIGFRNGRAMMMLLGDAVLLRPGVPVRAEGSPGMLPVGAEFLAARSTGPDARSTAARRSARWPSGRPAEPAPARSTGRASPSLSLIHI